VNITKLIERVQGIVLSPKTEWQKIAAEPADVKSLFTEYAMILAAIPALCGVIGFALIGMSLPTVDTIRTPFAATLVQLVLPYVLGLVALYVVALIVNALAPTFDGQKNAIPALKLVVYSSTPVWLAGVFALLPVWGELGILLALYGPYLLYIGLAPMMKNPPDKSFGYTALIIVCYIVQAIIVSAVTAAVVSMGMAMRSRF